MSLISIEQIILEITIKTVHDETRQKTTFIPCIDTDLLEGIK